MHSFRIEFRIFGLLIFALISTLILAYGLKTSDVQGNILGIKFTVVGPTAVFLVLVLIFFATGLFKFGLERKDVDEMARPVEKLSAQEIDELLDNLELLEKKVKRRTAQLTAARASLEQQQSEEQAMIASGFKPVRRPGIA